MKSDMEKQFSRYLANLMSKEERSTFEQKLASNDELKNEFEEYQIGMVVGERIQYLELKDKVAQIMDREDSKKENNSDDKGKVFNLRNIKYLTGLIAAMFLIFFIFKETMITEETQNGNEIFAANYTYVDEDFRGEIPDSATDKSPSSTYTPEELEQPYFNRELGHRFIKAEIIDSAVFSFKNAVSLSISDSEDEAKAHWYLGLLYCKLEQPDSAKHYLRKVVNSRLDPKLKKQAKTILSGNLSFSSN